MAEDAAGAVRRTPRPDEVPPLWWSPTKREVYWLPEPTSVNVWTLELTDESLPSDQRPADAVKLVSATLLDFALANVREWKQLAEERNGTARVMADLRDQAAAAEADRDAARSDREELRSERDQIANELEDAQQHARNVAAQRDVEHRAFVEAAAQRDLAVWLHAEAKHQHAELLAQRDSWWDHVGREQATLAAERDALRARLADGLAKIAKALESGPYLDPDETRALLAVLQGDQPTEPEPRCMNGPAKQHTLRMVEIIKALRTASEAGVLPDHLDERGSFAPLARAIVDHWPTGEVGRG